MLLLLYLQLVQHLLVELCVYGILQQVPVEIKYVLILLVLLMQLVKLKDLHAQQDQMDIVLLKQYVQLLQ